MRFQVSQVMDAIEQHLTTDITGAQAVADLGPVIRHTALDQGRPVNLVRIGMVVDALARYLVDEGVQLYGVVPRELLSDQELTAKERMVLGRWTDDGVVEATTEVRARVAEVADLAGLPLVAREPYPELADRYDWLTESNGRVLRLTHRFGEAALRPMVGDISDPEPDPEPKPEPEPEPDPESPVVGQAPIPPPAATADDQPVDDQPADDQPDPVPDPVPVAVFAARSAIPAARVRVSQHRFQRAAPAAARSELLRRQWRCPEFECPSFGEHRRIGQPLPRLRGDVPTCPRHGGPLTDIGPRPASYPVAVVVDDLPRRRLVVRAGHPVTVGRADDDPDAGVVSVARWLHEAAAGRISPAHLRLEAGEQALVVTDLSDNGTMVWQRKRRDDPGTTQPLRQESYPLSEWDSVELYTGIELVPGDRRLPAVLGRDRPGSVLVDAPTAAYRQLSG